MKKISSFVLVVILAMGISTFSFAVDGNELVTPYEKALAEKDPQVKEAIEIGKKVAKDAVVTTVVTVYQIRKGVKGLKSAAKTIKKVIKDLK